MPFYGNLPLDEVLFPMGVRSTKTPMVAHIVFAIILMHVFGAIAAFLSFAIDPKYAGAALGITIVVIPIIYYIILSDLRREAAKRLASEKETESKT